MLLSQPLNDIIHEDNSYTKDSVSAVDRNIDIQQYDNDDNDDITALKETPYRSDNNNILEGGQQQQQQYEKAMQKVLLERRALSKDMVRLQDSLMAKTQENLLLRGKLGIAELELDRRDEVTKECIEQIKKLHCENNRLQCILDTSTAATITAGGKHISVSSPASTAAAAAASTVDNCIIPQSRPMSAEEEYFRMVVLAVKLNSTYLDNLGLFDPKDLYQRACEEKVPFHQWHKWVESQMIRGIYRPLAGPSLNSPPHQQQQQVPGLTRGSCCSDGGGSNGGSGGGFFGNRLQLPDRVNGIFSSISKKVGRQSHHDTPKAAAAAAARRRDRRRGRRRRAASLELTPRGSLSQSSSEEDNNEVTPEGGMSKSTGKAAAIMNRNSHYRKQVGTATAVH